MEAGPRFAAADAAHQHAWGRPLGLDSQQRIQRLTLLGTDLVQQRSAIAGGDQSTARGIGVGESFSIDLADIVVGKRNLCGVQGAQYRALDLAGLDGDVVHCGFLG